MKRVYLDVCCLNRPFDDQSQERIRLEAEAILLILQRFESGQWRWLRSAVADYEIGQTPNPERRMRVRELARGAHEMIMLNASTLERGDVIKQMGFKTYDALHLACAEQGEADILLSTDDRLLRAGVRNAHLLKVRTENPLNWLQEVMRDE